MTDRRPFGGELTTVEVAAVDPPHLVITSQETGALPTSLVVHNGEVAGLFLSAADAAYHAQILAAVHRLRYPSCADLSVLAWFRNACEAVGRTPAATSTTTVTRRVAIARPRTHITERR